MIASASLADEADEAGNASVLPVRLGAAAVQAGALVWLTSHLEPISWPGSEPTLFVPLMLVAVFVPLLVMLACGQIGPRPLAAEMAGATGALALLGYHAVARNGPLDGKGFGDLPEGPQFFAFLAGLTLALFVAHVLTIDAVIERRLMPSYRRHFDTAWKIALQGGLSAVFVGVFWGVLRLGAGLFGLVGIDQPGQLLTERPVVIAATTLALAVALHVTDVQPALIRATRAILLTLFSWLTPLLVMIMLAFLATLLVLGSLRPLWDTHVAAVLMMVAAGALIFLINCCYQDGESPPTRIRRVAASAGSLLLIPLIALATAALSLRAGEYGWTVGRIIAASGLAILGVYAVGYALAIAPGKAWMKRIETTNQVAAWAIVITIVLLMSPVADPSRLMVAGQVARLDDGAIPALRFDFDALKRNGARWGTAALTEMANRRQPPSILIARQASAALDRAKKVEADDPRPPAPLPIVIAADGRELPDGLLQSLQGASTATAIGFCNGREGPHRCMSRYVRLRPDADEAILLLGAPEGLLIERDAQGKWRPTARVSGNTDCRPMREAFRDGNPGLRPHDLPDLVVADVPLALVPFDQDCTLFKR